MIFSLTTYMFVRQGLDFPDKPVSSRVRVVDDMSSSLQLATVFWRGIESQSASDEADSQARKNPKVGAHHFSYFFFSFLPFLLWRGDLSRTSL
jgi:hypothetical protein